MNFKLRSPSTSIKFNKPFNIVEFDNSFIVNIDFSRENSPVPRKITSNKQIVDIRRFYAKNDISDSNVSFFFKFLGLKLENLLLADVLENFNGV